MIVIRRTLSSFHVTAITFGCALIVFLLMLVCLTSSYWITADKFRQGLLYLCVEPGFQRPLPFGVEVLEPGCYPNRDIGYIKITALLVLLTILSVMAAAVLSGVGLCSRPTIRNKLFHLALYAMIVGLISNLFALVVYPTQFAVEIEESNRDVWELNFAYGLGWGCSILLFGAIMLLFFDTDSNEPYNIYVKAHSQPHL